MSYVSKFPGDQPKRESVLFAWVVCTIAFIGLPAMWTMVAHVSYVDLNRIDGQVHAISKSCFLFLIPFSVHELNGVQATQEAVHEGVETDTLARSQGSASKTDSTGYLILSGKEGEMEICVAPESLTAQRQAVDSFLSNSSETELHLFCVSHWNGFYFAIPLCLFSILFLMGAVISLGSFIRKCLCRA